jgi:hypothetical protein
MDRRSFEEQVILTPFSAADSAAAVVMWLKLTLKPSEAGKQSSVA